MVLVLSGLAAATAVGQDLGAARSLGRQTETGSAAVSTGHSAIDLMLEAPAASASAVAKASTRTAGRAESSDGSGKAPQGPNEQTSLRDALLREAAVIASQDKTRRREEAEEPPPVVVPDPVPAPAVAAGRTSGRGSEDLAPGPLDGVIAGVVTVATLLRDNRAWLLAAAGFVLLMAVVASVLRAQAIRGTRRGEMISGGARPPRASARSANRRR